MNALNLIQFESSLVFADAPAAGMSVGAIIGIIIGAVILLIFFFSFFPVGLAISAGASGVHVGLFQLVGMRIRKVNPHRIVEPLIKATKAGLDLNLNKMEAHYLAGGNVDRVVNALIASQRAGIALDFEKACAIDLAGRDVLTAVQMSVSPKVIETPVIAAIAKDGIELRAKAKVTVRVISTVLSAVQAKKRSLPASAKALLPPSVLPSATRMFLKTPTPSLKPF